MSEIHLRLSITIANEAEYNLEMYIYNEREIEAWIYRKGCTIKFLAFHGLYPEPVSEEFALDTIGIWIKEHESIDVYERLIESVATLEKEKTSMRNFS